MKCLFSQRLWQMALVRALTERCCLGLGWVGDSRCIHCPTLGGDGKLEIQCPVHSSVAAVAGRLRIPISRREGADKRSCTC